MQHRHVTLPRGSATAGRALRRAALLVLCSALAAAGALVPVPAAQAAASPTTPVFPRSVDAYATWVPETGCDPAAKPGAEEVVRILRATYGSTPSTNISRACTAASSGHEEGRAVDWMTNARVPAQKELAESFLAWLLATDQHGNAHAMARRLGVAYLIWDSRKLYLWNTAAGWTEYSDCLTVRTGPEHDNTCHRNHVHLSLSWEGARAQTSWWTEAGQTRGWCPPAATTSTATVAARAGGFGFVPLAPARLLDTRADHVYPEGCRISGGQSVHVQVAGRGGVPSSGVAAVALNLTAVDARSGTWLAARPTGTSGGLTSSVNVDAGAVAASLVVVPVGSGGRVTVVNGPGTTDVVVDVLGWFPTDGSGARYSALPAQQRVLDEVRGAGTWRTAAAGVPAGATAVVANATLDQPPLPGFAALTPAPLAAGPSTSTLNAAAGQVVANRAVVPLSGGSLALWTQRTVRSVVDVSGWFGPSGAQSFHPVVPQRLVDTRESLGVAQAPTGGEPAVVQVTGLAGVPDSASAAVVTLTAVGADRPMFLTAWPAGQPRPGTSDLNLAGAAPRANLVVAPLDGEGRFQVAPGLGTSHVVVDVLGYFS